MQSDEDTYSDSYSNDDEESPPQYLADSSLGVRFGRINPKDLELSSPEAYSQAHMSCFARYYHISRLMAGAPSFTCPDRSEKERLESERKRKEAL